MAGYLTGYLTRNLEEVKNNLIEVLHGLRTEISQQRREEDKGRCPIECESRAELWLFTAAISFVGEISLLHASTFQRFDMTAKVLRCEVEQIRRQFVEIEGELSGPDFFFLFEAMEKLIALLRKETADADVIYRALEERYNTLGKERCERVEELIKGGT